jgi:Asp-tRNA(Asn)/Glu-tRNA(Gln) amidotransferase B subunit
MCQDLISHLKLSLPKLPDTMVETLAAEYGLTTKDAGTLLSLDDVSIARIQPTRGGPGSSRQGDWQLVS